jgi:hypothetical protein
VSEIEKIARDLVALWQSPVIQGLARADRNAAIEDTRNALIEACSSAGSEQGSSNSEVEGSSPSTPTNATVAQPEERRLCKTRVGGSNPPGGTIYYALRDSVLEQAAKNLAKWYPDNANTSAFCAAIRSMKSTSSVQPPADHHPTEKTEASQS